MASIERSAYPNFARRYDYRTLQSEFLIKEDESEFVRRNARSAPTRLGLAALLKSFQYLRWFPEPEEIPPEITDFCRTTLGLGAQIEPAYGGPNTWKNQLKLIRRFLDVKSCIGEEAQRAMQAHAVEAAETKIIVIDIINATIERMVMDGYELPAFSTLIRVAQAAHVQVEKRLIAQVCERTSPELRAQLLGLLEVKLNDYISEFQKIKRSAGRATRKHFDRLIAHLAWLDEFGNFEEQLKDVIEVKLKHFASIGKQYDVHALADFPEDTQLVCIMSLIRLMQVRARDELGEMFLKRIAYIKKLARTEHEQIQLKQRDQVENLVITLGGVVSIIKDVPDDTEAGRQVRAYVGSEEQIKRIQSGVEDVQNNRGGNYFSKIWRYFRMHRSLMFAMLRVLELESTCNDHALMAAIELIKANQEKKAAWLEGDIDLSFASKAWQELVLQDTGKGKGYNRRHFEVCTFVHIADALLSGDMAIVGSDDFSDYTKHLEPWEACEKMMPEYCERLGLPTTADGMVDWLYKELDKEAKILDEKVPTDSGDVTLGADGRPAVRRGEARVIPDSVFKLKAEIGSLMPERHVMDCLENVEHWIGFTKHFGPLTGNEARLDDAESRYLMTIFTYGCNLGPVQAARHFRDAKVSAAALGFVNRRHVSIEMLENAQRELNEVYLGLDLPKMWGSGKTLAADGTQYDFFDDNLLAGHHFRYRKMGAVAYRHVADNYIAVFRHFIGPGIWEGVYLIEALMNSKLSVEAEAVHSDTQGQSASVFTYALLFGVKLMPRIRNWKDLRLMRPSNKTRYEHIDRLFNDVADWELIRKGWKQIMQVALSIATGRVSSARLLRKLSSHSRKNQLYFAAHAMGQVIRTTYLLRWIGSRELREEVTANTNKMESYNGYSKWTGFGGDVIPENDPEEQQKRIRYIDLVTSCLILQNTVDMTLAIQKLRKKGRVIPDSDLNFLSPYLGEHIMRFGKYRVRLHRNPEAWIQFDEFQAAAHAVANRKRVKVQRVETAGADPGSTEEEGSEEP